MLGQNTAATLFFHSESPVTTNSPLLQQQQQHVPQMSGQDDSSKSQSIRDEIDHLEKRLADARARLSAASDADIVPTPPSILSSDGKRDCFSLSIENTVKDWSMGYMSLVPR